ncbi:Liver carboxylesterase 1 [Cricetulus griseus]|uniref:Liver carboxylesterase 1 n=1 Tax=Cricetulus griseus TaxID=10029 RepID=G3I7X9_CRIGR|nr:Liver carboxylesterase 1 [Cricetulus griseus]
MCSQDAAEGQMVNDLLINNKEKIHLQFSEDCLYLNIYTPADLRKNRNRLPVMVWIHGGGLVVGGASTYDGLDLSAHENVVVVAIQYRLSIWGFFSTGDEHSRGNWGHLDQVAALRWVQDNIANFGGDPGSVTIFGESAGGESVSVLVLSPLAKNLFHRAISESGVVFTSGLFMEDVTSLTENIPEDGIPAAIEKYSINTDDPVRNRALLLELITDVMFGVPSVIVSRGHRGHPSSPPVVDTVHGKVLGEYVRLEGFSQPVAVFLGVPFAKPPLGSLRFAPPQPAEPWNSVKNATSYPPLCSQNPEAAQMIAEHFTNRKETIPHKFSEDCLYLNIYTPADLTKSSRLPVMVWIHGGGLVIDGASTYDGLPLAVHENVVVVVIQYRLGIWGFFSTGDEHSRGNWGHLDQVAALRWIQDNIVNFGGNPGSVTIFGESAGGESVSVLVLTPLAKNLFHRAISQSSVIFNPCLFGRDARPIAKKVAVLAGCKTTTSAAMVHCLRQKTEDELLEVSLKMSYPFLPTVIDGVLLPKAPEEILAEKNFNTVPYMVGINKQEFGWIIPMFQGFPISEDKLDQKTAAFLMRQAYSILNVSENLIPAATEKYLGGTDDPVKKKDLFLDLIADVMFGVPSVTVARSHRDAGAPTYMYEFQYQPSFVSDMRPKTLKGDHGDDLFSVWGAPFLKGGTSEEEINFSKTVMKFWANFARNGNPNGEGLPHWPEYDQKEGYLQIGVPTQAAYKLKDKEVAFWTELRAKEVAKTPTQRDHVEL